MVYVKDETLLIMGAAVAIGIGIWALKTPLENVTEGVRDLTGPLGGTVSELNAILGAPRSLIDDIRLLGNDEALFW